MITEIINSQFPSSHAVQKCRRGQHIAVRRNRYVVLPKAPQKQFFKSLGCEAPVIAPFLHGRPIDLTDSGDSGQEYSPSFQSTVERGDRRFYSVDLLQRLRANNAVVSVSLERTLCA